MPGVEPAIYLGHLRADGAALAEAARRDLDAPVPSCPGWAVDRLVGHVGTVHQWVAETLATRATERVDWQTLARAPRGPEVLGWYEGQRDRLVDLLEEADPAEPVWNWSTGPQVAGFWHRRMAQETAVHRWDAEAATGPAASAIEPALAADGIDEWLGVALASGAREPEAPVDAVRGSLHLHCTDVAGEWWVRLDGRELVLRREHAKGDAAVRGAASDLLLVLWGRLPPSAVEVLGDATVLDAWLRLVDR